MGELITKQKCSGVPKEENGIVYSRKTASITKYYYNEKCFYFNDKSKHNKIICDEINNFKEG